MSADSSPRSMFVTADSVELRQAVAAARRNGLSIGCVPTMGALHAGHLSLMQRARSECGFVIATLFVNPAQFSPSEDLAKYPRPFETDREHCRAAGVDLLFHPEIAAMYPSGFATVVEVQQLTAQWEGAVRPTHFRGVTTIVAKLLNLTRQGPTLFDQCAQFIPGDIVATGAKLFPDGV